VAVAPLLEVADRAELRAWLEANHATSPGVRLAIGKKGKNATSLTYEDAVREGLCFGWIDSTANRLDEDRFTVLFTRRKPGATWSASNKRRIEALIEQGCMAPAGLAAIETAKADGSWDLLEDIDALIVPADLEAALVEAGMQRRFEELSESVRKMALYWIATAKRPETRARRIGETVRAAREGRGPR
jgi:uncharacterized protein YdeI (YjbR/CyaY-like superfamily)